MNEKERLFVLGVGSFIAVGVTLAIIYLAITAADTGERSILFGALIGTGAFGGGALFSLLGVGGQKGAGPTLNLPPPPSDVTVRSPEDDETTTITSREPGQPVPQVNDSQR